ncbi:MAG: VPLPA-CTERM sorting domain-containing protein [Alkalilacustris sp.]
MNKTVVFAGVLALGFGGAVQAATVSITTSNVNPANTTALAGFATTGAGMDGMRVTARFDTGTVETATWGGTGGQNGAATGANWSVTLGGDSFNTPFVLSHTNSSAFLTGLLFEGAPGDTVFDMIASPALSPGSAAGRPFEISSGSPGGAITVTYSRPLSVGGEFFGDLYLNMDVDLSGLTGGGLAAGNELRFIADTDNVRDPGDITPTPSVIPVPAAGWLLLTGMAGLAALSRRRRAA